MLARALALAGVFFAAALTAYAQQAGRTYRVGLVSPVSASEQHHAFRQRLSELGYIEGRNLVFEARFAEGRSERIPGFVAELIRLPVDVLVVGSNRVALTAKKATATVPIVFAGVADPVGAGIVASLARPEGNITGVSMAIEDRFAGKWLELLKEAVPGITRVAILVTGDNPLAEKYVKELQAAARAVNVEVHQIAIPAGNPAQLDKAFAAIGASAAQGIVVPADPFFFAHRARLISLAASNRLPAVYFTRTIVADGGLMAYGPSLVDAYRQAATYVDRILKGSRPADLPIEQPTKYEFVINLKSAKALGLTIPRQLILRADHVVE